MELARVVGQVVATVKQQGLQSTTLLLVSPVAADSTQDDPTASGEPPYVAVDYAGAGTGEIVLVTRGSAARVDETTTRIPTDAAVVAIVDSIVVDAKTTFRKSG
jgi:microcompartment protein CcmK/EutM